MISLADLLKRIRLSREMIVGMCTERRCPKMSIPARPQDEDVFICDTLNEAEAAVERIERLESAIAFDPESRMSRLDWLHGMIDKCLTIEDAEDQDAWLECISEVRALYMGLKDALTALEEKS